MSYFGATGTSVLNFGWLLLWVSKPQWAANFIPCPRISLITHKKTYLMIYTSIFVLKIKSFSFNYLRCRHYFCFDVQNFFGKFYESELKSFVVPLVLSSFESVLLWFKSLPQFLDMQTFEQLLTAKKTTSASGKLSAIHLGMRHVRSTCPIKDRYISTSKMFHEKSYSRFYNVFWLV